MPIDLDALEKPALTATEAAEYIARQREIVLRCQDRADGQFDSIAEALRMAETALRASQLPEKEFPEPLLDAMVDAYNAVQSTKDRGRAQQEMGMQAALQAYLDAAEPQAPSTPIEGQSVPANWPTVEMIRAAMDCQDADPGDSDETYFYYAFRAAMLAAPQPQPAPHDDPVIDGYPLNEGIPPAPDKDY